MAIGPVKQFFMRKIAIIFLPISLNMCFGRSKGPSHRDGSFEYLQHMAWLRNKKNNFLLRTLIWGLMACCLTIVSFSHYQRRELSGRVLERLRGRWFEPHQGHCVVSLSKTLILA